MAGVTAMVGMDPNLPTEIKADFTANPVTVSTWRVNDAGIVAQLATGDGGFDTYFVPWGRLIYAKQHVAPVASLK